MVLFKNKDPLNRDLIFISGAPRSGTSMLTKVIDAHPKVSILMENIFENRRRHWSRADYWNNSKAFKKEISQVYSRLKTPIVGNKVCMPDAWNVDDILQFCNIFKNFKFIFIVRNPYDVVMSRLLRGNYDKDFSTLAKEKMPLDFRSKVLTYTSSWRQSIDSFRKLRDEYPEKVQIIYYEDFCQNFESQVQTLFERLEIDFHEQVLDWQSVPHCDKAGNLKHDLKYQDAPISLKKHHPKTASSPVSEEEIAHALATIGHYQKNWDAREI